MKKITLPEIWNFWKSKKYNIPSVPKKKFLGPKRVKAFFESSLKETLKENPQHRDFFVKISKSPAQGPHTGELFKKFQSLHTPQYRAHTQGLFENSQSLHTPQYRAHTQGNFEIFQSHHTPQYRVYTQGNFENFQSLHTTVQSPHTGELWKNSKYSHTTAQCPHTEKLFSLQGNFPKKTISSSTLGRTHNKL